MLLTEFHNHSVNTVKVEGSESRENPVRDFTSLWQDFKISDN